MYVPPSLETEREINKMLLQCFFINTGQSIAHHPTDDRKSHILTLHVSGCCPSQIPATNKTIRQAQKTKLPANVFHSF